MESELGRKMEREKESGWRDGQQNFWGEETPIGRESALEESTGMILRLVSKQGCVRSLPKESPVIQGAPVFPKLVSFLPHVPRDTSPMPDPLRLIGPRDQGTVYTALLTPHHCHHPFQLSPLWSLREASNQSSRLGLASRSESMASWHHWEQWLTFLPIPGGVIS